MRTVTARLPAQGIRPNRSIAAAIACAVVSGVGASASNLVANGNAETADTSGWTTTGVETIATTVPGVAGLPPGEDIGGHSFQGGTGDMTETAEQLINLGLHAPQIDAGMITAHFRTLVQSRIASGAVDSVTGVLEYRDAVGATVATFAFADNDIVEGVFDWEVVVDDRPLPAGVRSARLRYTLTRQAGLSTDAYFDNVELTLSSTCPADFNGDGVVDGDDLGSLLGTWGACGGCLGDLNGDDQIDGDDLGTLLGMWGPCAG